MNKFREKYEKFKETFDNAKVLNFYIYNFFLPLILPVLIFLFIVYDFKTKPNYTLINELLKIGYLFLIISFFSNIGLWRWSDKNGYFEKDDIEKKKDMSFLLGVISLVLYIFSLNINVDTNFLGIRVILLSIFLIILVKSSLKHSLDNPNVRKTDIEEVRKKSESEDNKNEDSLNKIIEGSNKK